MHFATETLHCLSVITKEMFLFEYYPSTRKTQRPSHSPRSNVGKNQVHFEKWTTFKGIERCVSTVYKVVNRVRKRSKRVRAQCVTSGALAWDGRKVCNFEQCTHALFTPNTLFFHRFPDDCPVREHWPLSAKVLICFVSLSRSPPIRMLQALQPWWNTIVILLVYFLGVLEDRMRKDVARTLALPFVDKDTPFRNWLKSTKDQSRSRTSSVGYNSNRAAISRKRQKRRKAKFSQNTRMIASLSIKPHSRELKYYTAKREILNLVLCLFAHHGISQRTRLSYKRTIINLAKVFLAKVWPWMPSPLSPLVFSDHILAIKSMPYCCQFELCRTTFRLEIGCFDFTNKIFSVAGR